VVEEEREKCETGREIRRLVEETCQYGLHCPAKNVKIGKYDIGETLCIIK
jgi:hypothetical protein